MNEHDRPRNITIGRCCRRIGTGGITFGSALAMILSYTGGSSIFWTIIHGLLS